MYKLLGFVLIFVAVVATAETVPPKEPFNFGGTAYPTRNTSGISVRQYYIGQALTGAMAAGYTPQQAANASVQAADILLGNR